MESGLRKGIIRRLAEAEVTAAPEKRREVCPAKCINQA